MNYYRRYIGDYGRDTTALSIAEHGAYSLLLDAYYANEHPLPDDLVVLYRICRATDKVEQAAVERIANKFFPVNGDGLRHNARADREIGKAKSAIEQMAEAGQRGARKRWGQDAGADGVDDGVPHRKQARKNGVTHAGGDAGADAGGNATSNLQPPTTSLQPPTARAKTKVAPVALPEWLDPEKFKAWIEIRPAKARTAEAQKAAIDKLERLRAKGFDPNEIVGDSLANGWQGIFEPKNGRPNTSRSVGDVNRAAVDEAVRRMQEERRHES